MAAECRTVLRTSSWQRLPCGTDVWMYGTIAFGPMDQTHANIMERMAFDVRTIPWGELPEPCRLCKFFCFHSLVCGDVISKHFWLCTCGLLACFCEGHCTR